MNTPNNSGSSLREDDNDSISFEAELPQFDVGWIEAQEKAAKKIIDTATSGHRDLLISGLKDCVGGELTSFSNEREERVRALIHAWTGGKMLLTYKAMEKPGAFGSWLAGVASAACTSVRTLQRHMKVAREFDTISLLVSKASSRRAAYLLSKNPNRKSKRGSRQSIPRGAEISAAFTKLQSKLRQLSEGDPLNDAQGSETAEALTISDVQRTEIIEAWKQIEAFYRKLINPA